MEHFLAGTVVVDYSHTLTVVLGIVDFLCFGVTIKSLRIEQLWQHNRFAGAIDVNHGQRPLSVTR